MPSTRSFFHKNRSQGSLLSTQESTGRRSQQASPIESPLHSPRFPSYPAVSPEGREGGEDYSFGQPSIYRPDEGRYHQASNLPTRSRSQRSTPVKSSYHQPTINLVGPPAGSAGPPVIDEDPDAYYTQPLPQAAPKEDSKRRRFFNLGSSSSAKEPPSNPSPANRLGRSISVRRKDPEIISEAEIQRLNQERRPSKAQSVASQPTPPEQEAEEEHQIEALSRRPQPDPTGPPPPEKDPLRSPKHYIPAQPEQSYNKQPLQGVNTNIPPRPQYQRQGSATSSAWENTARSLQHHRAPSEIFQQNSSPYESSPSSAVSNQTPHSYQQSPSSATSTSNQQLQPRGTQEVIQQYRHEFQRERPPSRQSSYEPPSPIHPAHRGFDSYHERQSSNRSSLNAYTPSTMGPQPPPQQQARGRHSDEIEQRSHSGPPPRESSQYQPYQQQGQGQGQQNNSQGQYGSQLGINQQNQPYRGTPQASPLPAQALNESGRNTPPPSRSRDDLAGLDVAQLLARHDELQDKYRKVKKYYFDKDAQVQQLQNTLAHQRLSQSRTSLDDNEYTNRFSRLDGAINNLAFNMRRDWRSVPPWLGPHVNKDATTSPTKEMTAVGRATISKWLIDEVLEKYFHPGLEPGLSAQLKSIELNLRKYAAPTPSEEEKEALMARIANWRMATLDGLHDHLNSQAAAECRVKLTDSLVENLTAFLTMHLKEPAPPGLEGGVSMIVELAIGVASNLPLESRDVFVEYVLPGARIDESCMKIESGLPPLTNPGEGMPEEGKSDDASSLTGVESKESSEMDERASTNSGPPQQERKEPRERESLNQQTGKKKSMFGGFMGGNKKAGSTSGSGTPLPQPQQQQQAQAPKEEKGWFGPSCKTAKTAKTAKEIHSNNAKPGVGPQASGKWE